MDRPALRELQLEKIRLGFVGTIEVIHLQARRDLAVMVVLLSFAGTALGASLAHQIGAQIGLPIAVSLLTAAGAVAVRMRTLAQKVRQAVRERLGGHRHLDEAGGRRR